MSDRPNANLPYFRNGPCVYAIRRGREAGKGPIKVGFSDQFPRRYRNLQSHSYEILKVLAIFPGSFHLEKEFHECLKDIRTEGEWFHDPERQAELEEWFKRLHEDDEYRERMIKLVKGGASWPEIASQ